MSREGPGPPPYVRPPRNPDFEAEISFLLTTEGGRTTPVASGYRSLHDFGNGELYGAQHEYPGHEWVHPGETVVARLWIFFPDSLGANLRQGTEFSVQEGPRVVGQGRIIRVLNPALETRND